MADLKTGVVLNLKDNYSREIANASMATGQFASKTISAVKGIDRAFSGAASKLAGLGVTLSAGAATKEMIDLDAKMMRIGVQAGVSAEKVNQLKSKIYATAQSPDIKIGTDDLTAALDAVIERTGDLEFAEGNLRAIGLAVQATGASGEDIGGLFAEFQKMGMGAKEAMQALDTLTVQGKQGAFTLQNLSSLGPRTISAYTATGRSGAGALREMGAALQVIRMGTGSSEQAATAFEAVMRNITSPEKQKKLEKLGVKVKDQSGNFKSIVDIMQEIVEASDGSTEALGQVFDAEAMRAFNFAIGEYKRTGAVTSLKKFNDIMGDGSTIQKDAARNASTMAANLKNLQTGFLRFADSNLSGPLEKLTENLNKLAENPEKVQRIFKTIALGLGAITAVKGVAGVARIVGSFRGLRGGAIPMPGASGDAAGAMPVFVTNMGAGGMGAGSSAGGAALSGRIKMTGKQIAGTAGAGAAMAAITAIPAMIGELSDINNDPELKGKAKSKAKGGAIGAAAGSIGGAAAGALAGAAIGSVVPVVGTAVGALIGGGIGMLGGILGRKTGEAIGEAVGKDEIIPQSKAIKEEIATVQEIPQSQPKATLEGQASLDINVNLEGERPSVSAKVRNNDTPIRYNTGNIKEARAAMY